jgi:hypothetical protein
VTTRTPYTVSLVGLAGLSLVALYRNDPLLMCFVVAVAALAISAFAWEARTQ